MKIIILLIGFIALIFVGISQYDKIKKETSTDEKKTEVSKVKKQTSDKKLEAENKPKK